MKGAVQLRCVVGREVSGKGWELRVSAHNTLGGEEYTYHGTRLHDVLREVEYVLWAVEGNDKELSVR